MKIRPSLKWAGAVMVLSILALVYRLVTGGNDQPQPETEVQVSNNAQKLPVSTVRESDNYQLIVGANPSVGKEQNFLPPASSVVVTNEAQLRLLIEQTKPKQTPVSK